MKNKILAMGMGWIAIPAMLLAAKPAEKIDGTMVQSKVVRVIVYPQWAYVTREAELAIPAGMSRFIFRGLPPWIDEDSVRVNLNEARGITIVGASTQTVFLARSDEEEVRRAEEEVVRLRDQIADLNTELASLLEEKKYLQELTPWKLGKTPQDGAPRAVTLAELRELKIFIQRDLLANMKQANGIERRIRALNPELAAREKAWQTVQNRGRLEQKEIAVELEARSDSRAQLTVSYLISGASWYPVYDARAHSEKGNVTFACKAVVQQSTGEDWSGASFTLSTIQPYLVREKPKLLPWYVNVENITRETQQQIESEAAPRFRSEETKGRMEKMAAIQEKQQDELKKMDVDAQQAFKSVNDNAFQALKMIRTVEERGTTVEFAVPSTFTIKADGKPAVLPIGSADLETSRRYYAAPAISKSTYVTGEIRNNAGFVFLPGEVKVYIDGNFMGKSAIDCVAQGEKFELYLGLEERIQVSRELDMKKSSTRSAGDRKRLQVTFVLEVKNYLKSPVNIEIRDQIPVSQDSAVKVKLIEIFPFVETIDKGIITWPLSLQPEETKQLRFEFQMEYPVNIYLKNALELERMLAQ
jgi:uncharacterized protein (TIGR02231 family)